MKKTITILLSMLVLAVLTINFTGCGGGESDPPTVTVSQDVTDAWRADTVTFTIQMSTNEKLSMLEITSDFTTQNVEVTTFTGDNNSTYEYKFVVPGTVNDGEYITITFKVTDNADGVTTKTATINVNEPAPDCTPFATEITTGVFYHIAGLLHGAYDLDGNATVGASGTASLKSMKNTDAAGTTFTGSWTSDAANGTMYVKVSTAYADICQENFDALYTSASATVTNPAAGDVYVAKKGTTKYVIEILTVEPTFSTGTGANQGRITFKYKK